MNIRLAICALVLVSMLNGCWLASQLAVRPAVKAGSWYSNDPQRLSRQLGWLLSKAGRQPIAEEHVKNLCGDNMQLADRVVALIAPHAAYRYSGLTAAYCYGLLAGKQFSRVFILGPKHRGRLRGAALPSASFFATPLGNLPVDTQAVRDLASNGCFVIDDSFHKDEHSLELQLPFIRKALGEVKIVPVLVGRLDNFAHAQVIAGCLRKAMRPDDLLVVSSDFTHYGARYKFQPFTGDARPGIENLDKTAFEYISKLDGEGLLKFQRQSRDTICGINPICVALALMPPGTHVTLLDYDRASGGDDDEESAWSVSYLAIAFTQSKGALTSDQNRPAAPSN